MVVEKRRVGREYGDFQTPYTLALDVCRLLSRSGVDPSCVLEPTCGVGAFVAAAADTFPTAHLVGADINPEHLAVARKTLSAQIASGQVDLRTGDFFELDWDNILQTCPGDWLITGNPPWVTNAALGALASSNLPSKSNADGQRGIEAVTGKSNFDISEAMLVRYLAWTERRGGWIGVLIKSAVSRRVLTRMWRSGFPVQSAAMYAIDASRHFDAAVDACLLVINVKPGAPSTECSVYTDLFAEHATGRIGLKNGFVVADLDAYTRWAHLVGSDHRYRWRSGIKHDCATVMELTAAGGTYRNGLRESIVLEDALLYPLLKSSDVHRNGTSRDQFMIVTQHTTGDDTRQLRSLAPLTWAYLERHRARFEKRGSSIYRNRPPFSIFGVGTYSFAPWKVAISGFYKSLRFVPVGPRAGRPTVFDDTVSFLACESEDEAAFLARVLHSDAARAFYQSMIFWSDKRPITIDILNRLNLAALADELGATSEYESFSQDTASQPMQLALPV